MMMALATMEDENRAKYPEEKEEEAKVAEIGITIDISKAFDTYST